MNTVEIDPEALEAEAAAAVENSSPAATAGGEPGASPTAGGPSPEQVVEGYKVIALAVIDRGAAVLTPAWTWAPAKKQTLSAAIAQAAYLWFGEMPIPPKWLALLAVGAAVVDIVDDNRDANGNLKPLRVVQQTKPATAAPASAAN